MQFRVIVAMCLMASGCLHRGADAVSTAMGALAVRALEPRKCVVPAPSVPEVSVEEELHTLMTENPRLGAVILTAVLCNSDDRAMFRIQVSQAQSACRDAWSVHEDLEGLGPDESMAMLDAKVAYESFAADCGATPGEGAYLVDFWAQIWHPNDPWSAEWDGCFGTPPDRANQPGAVLDYYLEEEGVAGR